MNKERTLYSIRWLGKKIVWKRNDLVQLVFYYFCDTILCWIKLIGLINGRFCQQMYLIEK